MLKHTSGDAAELSSKAVRLPPQTHATAQACPVDLWDAHARDWHCAGYYDEMQNDSDRMLDGCVLNVHAESARMLVLLCAARCSFAPAAEVACQNFSRAQAAQTSLGPVN